MICTDANIQYATSLTTFETLLLEHAYKTMVAHHIGIYLKMLGILKMIFLNFPLITK